MMAKIIATSFGAVTALFGLGGFLSPALLGALCSPLHNFIYLVLGAFVVYLAQRRGPSALVWGTGAVGACLLLAGLLGVILGRPGTPALAGMPPDDRLWVILPKVVVIRNFLEPMLELGSRDHMLNLIIGIALITAAMVSVAETPFRLRK